MYKKTMTNPLLSYLSNFKAEKGGKITHTRIGHGKKPIIYGGAYHIPDEKYMEFMELYYSWVVEGGNEEYLTEKQEDVLAIDFDFRYDPSIKSRQHTHDHIIDCVVLYAEKIAELVNIKGGTKLKAYILQKPKVNVLENKTKDGIHVLFNINLDRHAQQLLRQNVLPALKGMWEDLPITNDFEDVLDEGVTKASSNWQLIGSQKPGNEAYALTHIHELTYDKGHWDINLASLPIPKPLCLGDILTLSVRNKKDLARFDLKPETQQQIEAMKTKKQEQPAEQIHGLLTPPDTPPPSNVSEGELAEILDNISSSYWTKHDTWKRLVMAINSAFPNKEEAKEVALHYSKKTKKDNYDEDAVIKLLEADHSRISVGTIMYYSKVSNENHFYRIKAKYHIDYEVNDYSIAQTYLKLIGDNVKSVYNTPYIYEGRLWVEDTTKKKTQKNVVKTLLTFYEQCHKRQSLTLKNTAQGNDRLEEHKQTLKKITELMCVIKNDTKQTSILRQVLLFIEDTEIPFDKIKPYYFVFDNIAFDMKTGEEVVIDKYDYITQSTHYDYVKPTEENKKHIKKLIAEIMGNKDSEESYLSVLKSCCVGVRFEKFILANGAGRNGKGLISQLMALMLGKDYFYQGNCCTLTQQIKSGANPEIANMDKKRMIIWSEPEENAYLYLGVIKGLTGEDAINARGLYSSKTETTLMGTFILEVNGRPNINGKINDSAIERWINIYFPNLYTDNDEIIDNVKIFKQNKLYKEHEWRLQMRCALFDVLREVKTNQIVIPKSIRDNTLNYLLDNDSILKWFNQEYEIGNENSLENILKVSDLYHHFKETDSYINLSKKQKRDEYNKKGFIDKIKENVKLRMYYREEATYTIKETKKQRHFRNILTCVVQKEEESDNEDE